MADISLVPAPVLGGFQQTFATCSLAERIDIALISIAIPRQGKDALTQGISARWALDMPGATKMTQANGLRAIPLTADQFLLAFTPENERTEASVQADLEGIGYTTVQTDAWVILELSGKGSIAALERICPLDLDLEVFPNESASRTVMDHLGVLIARLADDRFWLMSARSSAASFLHAVDTSCRWSAI
ncbi:sarcosine oxidase subunit gamma [Boseongicola aestuarii]|uniref:Sarcosine oxidase, gamma subunit family n=1 Tax=Boseongicola aestuarii TaxID=1470561 RepID=A0A238IXR5_9RHOB|nr:hypothetical protein [Boseongicola aestuarii]SMX22550.1 Sarcosine oxidase, gamma subunit family [Boseongicola aestuarii]